MPRTEVLTDEMWASTSTATTPKGSLLVSSVQDAGSCRDSGNDVFVTSEHPGGALSASYDGSRWVSPTAVG